MDLLDDCLSSHTVNTLIDLEDNDQINNYNNNKNNTNDTTNNTNIYQNTQNRQPIHSTELIQISDPLNTYLPTLPNVNTPLPP